MLSVFGNVEYVKCYVGIFFDKRKFVENIFDLQNVFDYFKNLFKWYGKKIATHMHYYVVGTLLIH